MFGLLQLNGRVFDEACQELLHAGGAEALALGHPERPQHWRAPRLQAAVEHRRCTTNQSNAHLDISSPTIAAKFTQKICQQVHVY